MGYATRSSGLGPINWHIFKLFLKFFMKWNEKLLSLEKTSPLYIRFRTYKLTYLLSALKLFINEKLLSLTYCFCLIIEIDLLTCNLILYQLSPPPFPWIEILDNLRLLTTSYRFDSWRWLFWLCWSSSCVGFQCQLVNWLKPPEVRAERSRWTVHFSRWPSQTRFSIQSSTSYTPGKSWRNVLGCAAVV